MFLQAHSMQNFVSINFSEMWRKGKIPTKSIRVVDLKELSLMYDLEDFLINVDVPLRIDRDIDLFLATKSKQDIFYLAVTMIIKQHGVSSNDRFFNEAGLVSIEELRELTISGSLKKTNKLDSLYDLMTFAYRRCTFLFEELNKIESNKELFYYLCYIFNAIYRMIVDKKNEKFVGYLHVKAILTTLMKQKSSLLIKTYMKSIH
jgi:hypothetical protein